MIRPHFNDFPQHLFRHLNLLSRPLDCDDTILTRGDILIDLDVTSRAFLQVVDSDSLLSDDASHVHLGSRKIFGFRSPLRVPTEAMLHRRTTKHGARRRTCLMVTTILLRWRWLVEARFHRGHVVPLVWHVDIGRPAPPPSSSLHFVINQHSNCLHRVHEWIRNQEHYHFLCLDNGFWRTYDGYQASVRFVDLCCVVNLNLGQRP